MLIEITSLADQRLLEYTSLKDVALRRKLEPEHGIYMAESRNVIERALMAGHRPRSVLLEQRWLGAIDDLFRQYMGFGIDGDIPVYVGDESELERLTGFRVHRGALAAMERPPMPDPADLLADAHRICVLEDLVDHTNVGAAFRSAAALGIDAVVITPRCADPLYRRAVRVSMGNVFMIPWTRLTSWPATDMLRDLGFTTLALALSDDALSLADFEDSELVRSPDSRLAIILGTEGDGLSQRTIASADYVVRIPMLHHVDSLNVAAAAAVTFWALRRRDC
ncbi:MAG: RNA methyltransferase [Actinomycetaceae bacterium]|nr:RNA methyltransferase [Actinomycetaceae bacterium]MDY5274154.1 RNA methyltransferase [Arcanobacterium sp.]